jgi:hypothetical protein
LVEHRNGIAGVRGSNPLGSSLRLERSGKRRLPRRSETKAGLNVTDSSGAPRLRLGRPDFMQRFFYVYVLVSSIESERHYTGGHR